MENNTGVPFEATDLHLLNLQTHFASESAAVITLLVLSGIILVSVAASILAMVVYVRSVIRNRVEPLETRVTAIETAITNEQAESIEIDHS